MSEENVELVRRAYEADDVWSALGDRIAPHAEFDFTAIYPDRPVLIGQESMRRFREESPWEKLHFDAERYIDVDESRVLVFVRARATGKGSGTPVEALTAHEFTIRDGVFVRFKAYPDREEALKAAGLSE
jgi:ketosteroid isomerase-like protein